MGLTFGKYVVACGKKISRKHESVEKIRRNRNPNNPTDDTTSSAYSTTSVGQMAQPCIQPQAQDAVPGFRVRTRATSYLELTAALEQVPRNKVPTKLLIVWLKMKLCAAYIRRY